MSDKEIRFIDSRYNELFRIKDGESITITYSDGEKAERECKYIDDYHAYIGNRCFHICEFAELMERNGNKYEPTDRKSLDLKFVEQNYGEMDKDKFFQTEYGFTEVYYNPDADAGGQLVQIYFDEDTVKQAAKLSKNANDFFIHIESGGRGYLTDVGTPDFRGLAQDFINKKANFEGCTDKTMHGLKQACGIGKKKHDPER